MPRTQDQNLYYYAVNVTWNNWRLIWIIAFITGLVLIVRDTASARETLVGLGQIHRLLGISIVGIIALTLLARNASVPFKSIFFLWTIISLWQIMTTLWSTFPVWTLYRSLEYLIMVMITAYCAYNIKDDTQYIQWVNLIWIFIGVLVFSVWIGVILTFGSALVPTREGVLLPFHLTGLFPRINANSISSYGAIIAVVSFVRMSYSAEKKWKLLFLLGLVTMFLSQGRSGMGGFALGFVLVLMLQKRVGLTIILSALIGFLITLYAFDQIFWEYFRRGQSEQLFWAFSGRMTIWEYTYNYFIIQNPWTGYGAYSAGRFLVLGDTWGWSSLHSSWLELAVGIGVPATVGFAMLVLYSWFQLINYCIRNADDYKTRYVVEVVAVYTIIIFRSIFTTHLMIHTDYVFFLAIGSAYYVSRSVRIKNRINQQMPED